MISVETSFFFFFLKGVFVGSVDFEVGLIHNEKWCKSLSFVSVITLKLFASVVFFWKSSGKKIKL